MDLRSLVTSFAKGIATKLGEHVAQIVWGSLTVGGYALTWLLSPTRYSIQITRLWAAAGVAALVLAFAFTAWAARWAGRRRVVHLTPYGSRNRWGTVTLPDGSINAQFGAEFVAKNLSKSVQRLIVARLVKPRLQGARVHSTITGTAGTELEPGAAARMLINILVRGANDLGTDDIDAVFAVANDEGHEERLKVRLQAMPKPKPA